MDDAAVAPSLMEGQTRFLLKQKKANARLLVLQAERRSQPYDPAPNDDAVITHRTVV